MAHPIQLQFPDSKFLEKRNEHVISALLTTGSSTRAPETNNFGEKKVPAWCPQPEKNDANDPPRAWLLSSQLGHHSGSLTQQASSSPQDGGVVYRGWFPRDAARNSRWSSTSSKPATEDTAAAAAVPYVVPSHCVLCGEALRCSGDPRTKDWKCDDAVGYLNITPDEFCNKKFMRCVDVAALGALVHEECKHGDKCPPNATELCFPGRGVEAATGPGVVVLKRKRVMAVPRERNGNGDGDAGRPRKRSCVEVIRRLRQREEEARPKFAWHPDHVYQEFY